MTDSTHMNPDIEGQIHNAAKQAEAYFIKNFCQNVCNSIVKVNDRRTSKSFPEFQCEVCKKMVGYVTGEVVSLILNTDFSFLRGINGWSMERNTTYRIEQRREFYKGLYGIVEYAEDQCAKMWGITGWFNTSLSPEESKNPLIGGLNEFFEEENKNRLERMVKEVAPPDVLGSEYKKCKTGAKAVIQGMLKMIRKLVQGFPF